MQSIWQQEINFGKNMRSSERQMQSHLVKFDELNTTESDPLAQQCDSWIEVSLPRVDRAAVLGHRQSRGRHFGSDIQHVSISFSFLHLLSPSPFSFSSLLLSPSLFSISFLHLFSPSPSLSLSPLRTHTDAQPAGLSFEMGA